jgi:hypothetical protein
MLQDAPGTPFRAILASVERSPSDLRQHWADVEERLTVARRVLDVSSAASAWFEECLDHNELGLALEALEALAEQGTVGGDFWGEMERAATMMELRSPF